MKLKSRFYPQEELHTMGFKNLGENVRIARTATLEDPSTISIGNNSMISECCVLTGEIEIGDYTHIAHYTHLSGGYGIHIGNFVGISARCSFYTSNDDFSGKALWTPAPDKYRNPTNGPIDIMDLVLIGWNCLALPNVYISSGTVFESNCTLKGRYFGEARWGPRVDTHTGKIKTNFIRDLTDMPYIWRKEMAELL